MYYKYKFTIHNFIGESLYETSCIKLHVIISKFDNCSTSSIITVPIYRFDQILRYNTIANQIMFFIELVKFELPHPVDRKATT